MRTKFASLILILFLTLRAQAEFPAPTVREAKQPYPAIEITRLEYAKPRPLRVWAVRIDTSNPDVEFVVTPRANTEPGFNTRCATTLEFAQAECVQLAVNGSPFTPLRNQSGESMKIEGLHLSRGELIAPPDPRPHYAALLIAPDNKPAVKQYPLAATDLARARHGLGGYQVVVCAGKNLLVDYDPGSTPPHPRTAYGTSENGKYLWWLIADGRQPGRSEGLHFSELGELAVSLGIADLLNMDGGGSTTLVMQDSTTHSFEVVNAPVGLGIAGTLRQNGNNFGVRVYSAPRDLTAKQLRTVMPNLQAERVPLFLGALNRAMAKFRIDNPSRRAAFLAQLAHESGELRHMEELADGRVYEGRADLGNTQPGDGTRFKGRGPIQLTGRSNYRLAGTALDLDLENKPDRAADPEVGCQIAGWFWVTHGLNDLADAGKFAEITKRINGGTNGQASREEYWKKAKDAMSVGAVVK